MGVDDLEDMLDDAYDRINEERWEYDLPPLAGGDIGAYWEDCMDEKYGYDIHK